ncbi:MAG TPA: ribonuclease Z [Solirubrobacteraceae bacterium]|nr:ribonuclease Z [Solirubrobacteraceae bacterium]
MDLSIFFAGTAGSVPSARRGLPALLVRRGGDSLLFDCGEGTQRQLVRSVGLADVDDVFLTHFHADHWLGIPGLIKTFELRERERPLQIYGPPGVRELMQRMRPVYGNPSYELTITELARGEEVERDGYAVVPIAVDHGAREALGFALVERERPGRFDDALARELGVTPGPDFGRLQRGETVGGVAPAQVLGPPRAGRKLVISGDTRPCDTIAVAAHEADLLVHEATFMDEERDRAAKTGHSTARQAAEIAAKAGVRMLALVHLSTRYFGREVRDEARSIFPGAVVPHDFDTIEIPLPERGEPKLVRWEQERPSAPAAVQ